MLDVAKCGPWAVIAGGSEGSAPSSRSFWRESVLVLGYHHSLAIASQYGTLDRISGGRLVLGGCGFTGGRIRAAGRVVQRSGARAHDALCALRASMSTPEPAYTGSY